MRRRLKFLQSFWWSFLVWAQGCVPSRYLQRELPQAPYDAIFVPGCPSLDGGGLSRCQMGRAGWAAWLYQHGVAPYIVASGGAVLNPYVEAEAIAEAIVALGVPAERVFLESYALHTDENMWNMLQIGRQRGWKRLVVASNEMHAAWACRMLEDWMSDGSCVAYAMDIPTLEAFMPAHLARLEAIRSRRVEPWQSMAAQESERERRLGRARPPSFALYPFLGYLRWIGRTWQPVAPKVPVVQTWADRSAAERQRL
jgi:DUF218 domain